MAELTFYFFAVSACAFAFLTVTSRHIFHSAIWLSLVLLSVAGIYFLLGAEFLGTIQILVYIGGIITLFIFAIKLTAKIDDASIKQVNAQVFPAGLATIVLFGILSCVITVNPWMQGNLNLGASSLKQIGESLLTTYALPFEFISIVLLAAMVGAIVIGRGKK